MKHKIVCTIVLTAILVMTGVIIGTLNAEARAGGGRSSGSRGSRSYSKPVAPPSQAKPYQQATPQQVRPMSPPPFQTPQPAGGGFFRSMAGGIVGGMLGGMLFRSMGFGGSGGGGGFGGGIGIFEILLIGGIIYFIYRMIKKKREEAANNENVYSMNDNREQVSYQHSATYGNQGDDPANGLAYVRQMDPMFDEQRFNDLVMDIFFKIQGAWMNRDLAPVSSLLTQEMRKIFQDDIDRLLRERRINRLENIAVRNVELSEVWQESGQDYITAMIYANLLDYTTDEAGQVVEGSKTDPVKFEEYWTFTRPVGNNPWQLSAINQK
jgi:predicted lipid-binding transport protein (Tim44 family)